MKIVHVFQSYYPFVGGMERVVQELSEAQAVLGHEVHVLTSYYGASDKPSEEILNNVHIHRIKTWRFHYPDLSFPRKIPCNLLQHADVVHLHAHHCLFSLKTLEKANELGVKSVCCFMGLDSFSRHPNIVLRYLGAYYRNRNTLLALQKADLIIVKSIRDLKILELKHGVKAEYLPDGISQQIFSIKKNSSDFREIFGIKEPNFFLFIGRLQKLKGPQILVKALKYVGNDVAIVFIGPDDGYAREVLALADRLGVRNRVYMLGYVNEVTKIHAIDSSIAVINPSLSDNVEVYSLVISEAWAREKPVIASRVGELAFRVKHNVDGILVDPSNPVLLAEAMLKLVNNNKLATEMGKNGKYAVLSWPTIAIKSIELYKYVLNDKKGQAPN